MRISQQIQAEINRIKAATAYIDDNGNVQRRLTQVQHTAIGNAEQWLANGGYSRYANEDFDVLSSLKHL